ncbi:hypothetical protein AIOL_001818 [Candidatus Rhodobacter oscarellae]|uniref:Tellurium resistance protein n=1 Tax=Candidatus Rhodobacter oscarellae TaxID=1675527 RepID=A0A0J9E1T5_9RHOB|nr:tellurium resistance protein [Candidatus Rhodobacter lobularis]KMW56861.1 hypothetical protein AIOL_001818 [Candidatus Rhodobacter lobularis]
MQDAAPFWRRTPPAVFSPILGLTGLAMAWLRAGEALGFGAGLGRVLLFLVLAIFLFALGAYIAKLIARPATLVEDLRGVPGRLGLGAAMLSGMLLAAGVAPFAAGPATLLLYACLAGHLGVMVLIVRVLAGLPRAERRTTPAWHLTFVGFIVAPFGAIALGHLVLAAAIFVATVVVAMVIFGISAEQLKAKRPPAPARPLLAIHVAPLSLFATAAYLLNLGSLSVIMAILASLVFLALVANLKWLLEAGFAPPWAALTFPLAAYAGMLLALGQSAAFVAWLGLAVLLVASLVVPLIAGRIFAMWARGALAKGTGAAIA